MGCTGWGGAGDARLRHEAGKGRCKVGPGRASLTALGPPVLEPGLDLRVRHFEGLGSAIGRSQVLLAVEALSSSQICTKRTCTASAAWAASCSGKGGRCAGSR